MAADAGYGKKAMKKKKKRWSKSFLSFFIKFLEQFKYYVLLFICFFFLFLFFFSFLFFECLDVNHISLVFNKYCIGVEVHLDESFFWENYQWLFDAFIVKHKNEVAWIFNESACVLFLLVWFHLSDKKRNNFSVFLIFKIHNVDAIGEKFHI